MSENAKCKVVDQHVIPCVALDAACDGTPPLPKQKTRGLFVWALTNVKTGNPSRTLYGVKGDNHPRGLIFNFCPWCGENLSASHGTLATEAASSGSAS